MQVEFPVDVTPSMAYAASLYHGGQTSDLYSLCSTSRIHSWDHVKGLESELNQIFREFGDDPDMEMKDDMCELHHIVSKLAMSMPEYE